MGYIVKCLGVYVSTVNGLCFKELRVTTFKGSTDKEMCLRCLSGEGFKISGFKGLESLAIKGFRLIHLWVMTFTS